MKSSRKKIVRKKIRSKLGRKKRSKAKIRKVKGGGDVATPTLVPLDNYNKLVFDIDGTILPGLCIPGSRYNKVDNDSLDSPVKKEKYLVEMINQIKIWKKYILELIKLLLKIKLKKNIRLVILTRCKLSNTLKNETLWYEKRLTNNILLKKNNIDTNTLNNLFYIIKKKEANVEVEDGQIKINNKEVSVIYMLYSLFDELYGKEELITNDCDDLCKENVKYETKIRILSAFVKASYFKQFVSDVDKQKVLFFDDDYINTTFVCGLGYNCVIPKKIKGIRWGSWVNDALSYLLGIDYKSFFSNYDLIKGISEKEKKIFKKEVLNSIEEDLKKLNSMSKSFEYKNKKIINNLIENIKKKEQLFKTGNFEQIYNELDEWFYSLKINPPNI